MKFRIFRDPNADGGGGNADPNAAPGGAGAGAPGAGAPGGGSPEPWKGEIQSFRGDLDNRFGQLDQRFGKVEEFINRFNPDNGKAKDDAEPAYGSQQFPCRNPKEVQEWIDAKIAYGSKKTVQSWQQEQEQANKARESEQTHQKLAGDHVSRMGKAMERYKDFNEAIAKSNSYTYPKDAITDIWKSDLSADIQYLLGKDATVYHNLMTAYQNGQGLRYVGKLEARLEREEADRQAAAKKNRVGVTQTVGGDMEGTKSDLDEIEDIVKSSNKRK